MQVEVGKVVDGKVSGITTFGAFISLAGGKTGLVHISEVADEYVKDIKEHLKENQTVRVKVLAIDEKGKISLSIKKALMEERPVMPKSVRAPDAEWRKSSNNNLSFEEQLSKYMKDSEEKIHDLKKSFESKRGSGFKKTLHF